MVKSLSLKQGAMCHVLIMRHVYSKNLPLKLRALFYLLSVPQVCNRKISHSSYDKNVLLMQGAVRYMLSVPQVYSKKFRVIYSAQKDQ